MGVADEEVMMRRTSMAFTGGVQDNVKSCLYWMLIGFMVMNLPLNPHGAASRRGRYECL